jgi:SAM-dependent methyltransferase
MVETGAAAEPDWPGYVAAFHAERAGITEDVLVHAFDDRGRTPYDWAAEALAGALRGQAPARVVDLAWGSAPMSARLEGHDYVGMDLSEAELARARVRGLAVAVADAGRLPLPDASADAVVMSMALMLVPLRPTLAEVRRVLRPGGTFIATVPHNRPMPARDWVRYGRLCLALRDTGLRYPNHAPLRAPAAAFSAAGLVLQQDRQIAFTCDLGSPDAAEQLLASLYLPEVHPARMQAGRRVVRRWAGSNISTPIRLLVARTARV